MATTGKREAGRSGGIFSPLRLGLFRALWLANLISATGTTVQGVGAAWLMITLAGTPDRVALVQTATHAPILLLALLAGTLADLWDRRRVLLLAQLWTVLAAVGLALLSSLGLVTPSVLLLFTFFIGTGAALTGPAWQASVREIVPREELAAAVTLNAIAFNIARALGPAIGGIVVAAAGAAAACGRGEAPHALIPTSIPAPVSRPGTKRLAA
jgi:MFS family permease